jgi:hypothetical protein
MQRILARLTTVIATVLCLPLAAQPIENTTAHERFACLQRERALEPLADKTPDKQNKGLVRLKLRFVAPDRAPKVEVLQSYGDPDMERIARRYVEGYRLPCLHGHDHPVEVVQDFSFSRWGTEPPVPWATSSAPSPQVKRPDAPLYVKSWDRFEPGKILVNFTFKAGQDEPEIKFVFSGVGSDMQRLVENHVRSYRLEDPQSTPLPFTGRQQFSFLDGNTGTTKFRLRKDTFSLIEFLQMTKNLREHPIDLDLDRMACPFALRVSLRQPYERNGVFPIESVNANRAYLMDWLGKLQLSFKNEAQQKDLFGTDVKVNIPCGRLDLSALAPKS